MLSYFHKKFSEWTYHEGISDHNGDCQQHIAYETNIPIGLVNRRVYLNIRLSTGASSNQDTETQPNVHTYVEGGGDKYYETNKNEESAFSSLINRQRKEVD